MNQGEVEIKFKIHWYWEGDQLFIECETRGARDFIAGSIEDKGITVKVKG